MFVYTYTIYCIYLINIFIIQCKYCSIPQNIGIIIALYTSYTYIIAYTIYIQNIYYIIWNNNKTFFLLRNHLWKCQYNKVLMLRIERFLIYDKGFNLPMMAIYFNFMCLLYKKLYWKKKKKMWQKWTKFQTKLKIPKHTYIR